jgi:hypothetical protein
MGVRMWMIRITGEKFVGGLPFLHQAFNGVGWFIPPYIQSGLLHKLAGEIASRGEQYSQDDLEAALSRLYGAYDLAAMVMHRYTIAPVIRDYRETIAEAVEAHFFGLNHIAIGGLVPVIEGAGRRLALQRGLGPTNVREVFLSLAEDCKNESITKNIGATDEIVSMMDSFATFTSEYMYVGSQFYPLSDRTNRHGITHGAYSDDDYGRPLNFYKVIAAIDFLTLVASFRANISWLGPSHTEQSLNLARYYAELAALAERRVR